MTNMSNSPFAGPSGSAAESPSSLLGEDLLIYRVLRGGMGEVVLCGGRNSVGPERAYKTFQPQFFFDSAIRQAFIREATVWSRLTGLPHILPALELTAFGRRPTSGCRMSRRPQPASRPCGISW
jgi:hypothetical protein